MPLAGILSAREQWSNDEFGVGDAVFKDCFKKTVTHYVNSYVLNV